MENDKDVDVLCLELCLTRAQLRAGAEPGGPHAHTSCSHSKNEHSHTEPLLRSVLKMASLKPLYNLRGIGEKRVPSASSLLHIYF